MFDYLVQHAIKNVWCNPNQDNQHIISPCRLSSQTGVLNYCTVMMHDISLPTIAERYHIFQIGQIHPLLLGLFTPPVGYTQPTWTNVSTAMNNRRLIVDIYTDTGIQIPRFEVYYLYTRNRDLIIAIKENKRIPIQYGSDTIYIRVYTNAYFNSLRDDPSIESIYTTGMTVRSTNDILSIQAMYSDYSTRHGLTTAYVNGYLVNGLSLLTVHLNDTVELVYDSSVMRVVTFTISDLNVFDSILDAKRKYLLHYPADDIHEIEYHDDMDIYILDPYRPGQYYGVYYHKNVMDACRMVTHRDYSITVPYVVNMASQLQSHAGDRILDQRSLQVRLHIRHSGYNRPLIYENTRIHELYKLPDASIVSAMTGIDSTIDMWRAEHLEMSDYTTVMRSWSQQIDRALVQSAYGYNAISKLIGDTPSITYDYSNVKQITVHYGLQLSSTAYEYDSNGILLGVHPHIEGYLYDASDINTHYVEMISGIGSHTPDVRFGSDNIPLPANANYRVYLSHTDTNGVSDDVWRDITDTDYYTVENDTLIWRHQDYNQLLMVRSDDTFLAYDVYITPVDGNIYFPITEMEDRGDGLKHHELHVPMGELDVFLNGRSLIEGLDYIVNHPMIVIRNKEYLTDDPNTTPQWIHVRYTGFCDSNLNRSLMGDVGYIVHGVLSNNDRYDIRDDKVLRIVVDGRLKSREDVVFSEFHSGVSILDTANGRPYQIRDIVVPLRNVINGNTYTMRSESMAIDQAVSGYMTSKLPQPPRDAPSAIPHRYIIYSPFLAIILNDLASGAISMESIQANLSNNDITRICKPYESWLQYDAINPTVGVDNRYVVIHPHNDSKVFELNLYQYRFIKRVVDIYCKGLVDITPFISLSNI